MGGQVSGVLTPVAQVVGIAGGLKGLLSGPPKIPEPAPPPPIPEPTVMPVPDDEAARRAQRRRVADIRSRGGRLSTILTEQSGSGSLGAG